MSNNRKSISKKLRYEVFKRDGFCCQYCGRSSPQVMLHVDHIKPVAAGGDNNIMNLITACSDCNLGKGARSLSDDAVILKEKKQLDLLNERREQLEMMMAWHKELCELDEQVVAYIASYYADKTGYTLNKKGIQILSRSLNTFSLDEALHAIDTSIMYYGQYNSLGQMTKESVEKVLSMIYPICSHKRKGDIELGKDSIYYTAGILHNRFNYPKKQFLPRLKKAEQCGIELKKLKEIALAAQNYRAWRIAMESLLGVKYTF